MIFEFTDVLGRRLVAWGVLSVGLALPMLLLGDAFWRAVGLQFALWGLVDGVIGVVARRLGERGRRRTIGDLDARARETRRIRLLLLVNAALDVGYLALGAWLLAGAGDDPFRAGSGVGVIVQGAFLLAFDLLHAAWVPAPGPILPADVPLFTGPAHEPFRLRRADDHGQARGDEPAGTPPALPGALLLHGFTGSPAEMRPLAAVLAANGWLVEVPRLPGHGPEIRDVAEYRLEDWIATALAAADDLREAGAGELLVVGHSVGAALALATASRVRPEALVLLAPFSWATPAWQRVAGPLVRVVLPPGFRPFRRADVTSPEVRSALEGSMPGVDLDDPQVLAGLRDLQVPLSMFEQLFRVSAVASAAAPAVTQPVLAIQGRADTVATPARTRRLLERLPAPPRYLELEAAHDLLTDASPVRDRVLAEILAFAREPGAYGVPMTAGSLIGTRGSEPG